MNRKEMVRAWKERRLTMGVYRVVNTVTGTAIVAATTDLDRMLVRHRAHLRLGGHASRALQAEWAEHGEETFVFETLDTLEPAEAPDYDPIPDLTMLEDLWLERLGVTPDRRFTIAPQRLPPPPIG